MRLALILSAALLATACDAPKPDPTPDTVPEPQAQAANTELRDAIQAPLDKAREVETTQADDEARRQQALEDAGG